MTTFVSGRPAFNRAHMPPRHPPRAPHHDPHPPARTAIIRNTERIYLVNPILSLVMELLASAPSAFSNIEADLAAWHAASSNPAKTAVAVNTATQIIQTAGALATSLEGTSTITGGASTVTGGSAT